MVSKRPSLKQGLFFLLILILGTSFILFLNFIHYRCPILEFFHLYCAGCGGTRMFLSILHLDFYQAFRYNPLLFILLIMSLFYFIFMGIVYLKKKVLVVPSLEFLIGLLIVLVIYMILRNLGPFVYLIPTEV